MKQGVVLTGRNRTGPPYSVDRLRSRRPDRRQRYRRRQQTMTTQQMPASKTILAH